MFLFIVCFAALVIYMSAWFLVGQRLGRLDVADTAWGGGFMLVASIALVYRPGGRTVLVWVLTMAWGLRLASHIWKRNRLKGPDPRYEALSAKWNVRFFWLRAYLAIFMTQAVLIFVVSLPVILNSARGGGFSPVVFVGLAMWLTGFAVEVVADRQLANFVTSPHGSGKVLQTGLWRFSRHPNYFGELLLWWGIGVIALGAPYGWLGLAGPLALTYLIVFVSGIPSVERRYEGNAEYRAYKRKTSSIVPFFRR